jgi:glycosyl transferase family 2
MLRRLFSRKEVTIPVPGIEKIDGFIQYLEDRNISRTAISHFTRTPGKKQMASSDTLFKNSKYFIIPDSGSHHPDLIRHLDDLGLRFFEGQLNTAPTPHTFLIGGIDINYKETVSTPQKVIALIHVFNEADILGETIRHLIGQGVYVHIIDNWSTDESWEIAGGFPDTVVSRERFPKEGPSEHYEWYKQLEYSEQLAETMPYDWFIHYDSDEMRYSPWQGVSIQHAIGFIDQLGYNAIDFTVLDFRHTPDNDQVKADFEKNITWFEFGKRPGHFLQVKGWKKQPVRIDLKNSGGHNVQFPGRKLYPVKFLTKHYSLRSREQAEKKLVLHRLPRVQKELAERNWHHHINLLIAQEAVGWDKKDLIEWVEDHFDKDYLIERISGVGINKG